VPALCAGTIVLPFNDTAAVDAASPQSGKIACIISSLHRQCGFIKADTGYLATWRKAVGNGAVLIFDEVMTGFRLARGGVQD